MNFYKYRSEALNIYSTVSFGCLYFLHYVLDVILTRMSSISIEYSAIL